MRDWLCLLNAYSENNMPEQKDEAIRTMHYKFILSKWFWLGEFTRRLNPETVT